MEETIANNERQAIESSESISTSFIVKPQAGRRGTGSAKNRKHNLYTELYTCSSLRKLFQVLITCSTPGKESVSHFLRPTI